MTCGPASGMATIVSGVQPVPATMCGGGGITVGVGGGDDSCMDIGIEKMINLEKMVQVKLQMLREYRNQESQSDVIQREKNNTEGTLMRYFAKQLFIKINHRISPYQKEAQFPFLSHFLYVVDVQEDMVKVINNKCSTVEEMVDQFTDQKISGIFYSHDDDTKLAELLKSQQLRLCMALKILCSYVGRLLNGEKWNDLQWSSWSDTLPDTPPPDVRSPILNYLQEYEPPVNEELIATKSWRDQQAGGSRSIPQSPTASRRHQSVSSLSSVIPRSQSDDANIGHSTVSINSISKRGASFCSSRKNRPAPIIIRSVHDDTDSDHSKSRSSSVSQSPRTPNSVWNFQMAHSIKHRFSTKQLLISIACDHCHRLMFIGLKCKECGFKCHKKCSANVTPSCGLPEELLTIFKKTYERKSDGAHGLMRTTSEPSDFANQIQKPSQHRSQGNIHICERTKDIVGRHHDSGSITSSASSMSSSPFQSDSPAGTPADVNVMKFSFDVPETFIETVSSTTDTIKSTDTVTHHEEGGEQSKSSTEKSDASTVSYPEEEYDAIDELHEQISGVVPKHVKLRDRGSLMSEWAIPFSEVDMGELIGEGRVGKVYRARWHGEVALKILCLENPTAAEKEDFKYKVQGLRRTRHENLILFMGACMEPPQLAIVCSLCKGSTLYTQIYHNGNTFYDAKLIDIIKQISHGMSYLHAKGIVHRDLKTKNIFLEGNKVVITDFGLISMADVKVANSKRPNHLIIPRGWLCYQAPEIIRVLDPRHPGAEVPKYTNKTDVYSFGTVWFELLAGHRPFDKFTTEPIIWQIGRGYKQPLSEVEISREMKDIFNMIWNYTPEDRPSFHEIIKAIETIPKRKLIRSPSQPTYLLTSATNSRYMNAIITDY